jgi:hypothetical protein
MSHIAYYSSDYALTPDIGNAESSLSAYKSRPIFLPVLFLPATLLAGASWMMNGSSPLLTDLSFLMLTCLCGFFTVMELINFPRRFGVGGIVLFGGTLLWFCYDYMTVWYGVDFRDGSIPYPAKVIAKSTFFHCLFVMMMCVGLLIPRKQWLSKFLNRIPQPASRGFYFKIVIAFFILGISPYFFFTVESPWRAIWLEMWSNRGTGAHWTVGRTGNINYNWGGYVAQLLDLGQFGSILAIFYVIIIGGNLAQRVLATLIWIFWLLMAIGSGARGQVVVVVMPAIALMYIRFQATAVERLKKFSLMAYVIAGVLGLGALLFVQMQGFFRGRTLDQVDFSQVSMTDIQGNRMFSEGLDGFDKIPDIMPYFCNNLPGEGAMRAMPQTLFWFLIGPMPRALWHSKPIDSAWAWRAETDVFGRANQGTTVSTGLVGYWYVRYGIAGVIEGGILCGWLMVCMERALQDASGRPLVILFSLGFLSWMFLVYRDFVFLSLYPMLMGLVALWIVIAALGSGSATTRNLTAE